jgi:DNA-binding NtrC family response regulator
MAEALRAGARCARSRAPVLISGEPGTGKRRLARHIHAHSPRAPRAVVRVQCAEEEPSELERRLFGDVDGVGQGRALLEIADGGTLLLEEIGELAERVQERLAATLSTGRLEPRGGRPLDVETRLIATSSQDLDSNGRLRPELLELASALRIELLPLRERPEDILPLAEHFAARAARELGRAPIAFTAEAVERLLAWSWPANVRELEYVVRRAALLATGSAIDAGLLGFASSSERARGDSDPLDELAERLADMPIADVERIAILATLESAGGNKTEAARRLGLTARTLSNKLKLWRSQGLVA